jgi:DNA-binding winged helix-turn-helix (wHTH) protein/predicted ATPase
MDPEQHLTFGPFRLEMTRGRVWRGDQVTTLRPRSLAMLKYLVEHPGRLVTKAELRQHVWAGTHVTDTVLRVCVQEIRAALGDAAAAPQYLETVGRRGYRWRVAGSQESTPPPTAGPLVGRQGEVEALERWFQQAAHGTRQLVFVSGEAGVGKTTVVELLLARLDAGGAVRIARGQCVEQYGEGEPYLPVLEALGQLSRGPSHQEVLAALRRYAPMWLGQLPGLLSETELERLQRHVQGASPARMLRELADVLDVLSAEAPLVLVLEDLQWSDHSTVEALAYVAQRREPARLLVLGTYRPVETVLREHPLRHTVQELCGRAQGVDLRLEFLPAEAVAEYVAGRLAGPVAATLAAFIHERTEGNALFMVNIVAHLVQQGLVVRRDGQWTLRAGAEAKVASLPEALQQFLLRRIEAFPPEARRVLEAASVAGEAFAAAVVAAGLQRPLDEVEEVCERLAAWHHIIDDTGLTVWPDGTSGGAYRFQHALYQQVLYGQLGSARRVQLHRRIGARLKAGYGAQMGEIAAQLAVHFERGGETYQSVHYWQQAGDNAARRNAAPGAIAALKKGLALLATLPDNPERARHELALQLALGELLIPIMGRMGPEVREAYTRAHALCHQVGDTPQRLRALWGLVQFYLAQAQVRTAGELTQQLFDLAQRRPDPVFLREGHLAMGATAFYRGDFIAAEAHLGQSPRVSNDPPSPTPSFHGGFVSGVTSLTWLALTLWALGYADQARQQCQEMLTLARQVEHTMSVVYTERFAAILSQCRRDVAATQVHADAAMTLATTQGTALRVELGRLLWGWALAMRGDAADGVAQLRQGLAAIQGMGLALMRPHGLSLLAEAYGQAGQPEVGLTVLAEALTLVRATEERWWEAELYRLQGALLLRLQNPNVSQAEACFQQALAVTRGQQAKALELRSALSLSRLWQQQGQREAARELLAPIYGWFTEGLDTADLQEAKALLEELS